LLLKDKSTQGEATIAEIDLALAENDLSGAQKLVAKALQLPEVDGAALPYNHLNALVRSGRLMLMQGEAATALRDFDEATRILKSSNQAKYFAALWSAANRGAGEALLASGHASEAQPRLTEAVAAWGAQVAVRGIWQAQSRAWLALSLCRSGEMERGRAQIADAAQIFEREHAAPERYVAAWSQVGRQCQAAP
jgi:tetratricopeptide (TPR) repeat protein